MIQTANLNYNSPSHGGLAGLHPNNGANINGRIISRSPTALHLADQRNLSPNKLNATKKPMFGQNHNTNINITNFTSRGRTAASPTPKVGNICPNFPNNGFQNYNPGTVFGNLGRQPLLNSNGYANKNEPLPNNLSKVQYCQNHHNKPAEFFTQTEHQQIGYCQKCAINLASKGFSVTKISQRTGPQNHQDQSNIFQKHKLDQFYYPQYMNAPGYHQIQKFISSLDGVHSNYLNQIYKYQNIEQHYKNQYEITEKFYDSLLELVEQMKEDHLGDLVNQANKHTQFALIKEDLLKSDLEEIEVIRNDLSSSLELILADFGDPVIQKNLSIYRQQMMTFKDKIEDDHAEFVKTIINEKESQLKIRLKKIEDFMLDVWNDKKENQPVQPTQSNHQNQFNKPPINAQPNTYRGPDQRAWQLAEDKSPKSVKHLLNLNSKPEPEQKKVTAYRKLFEDENENAEQSEGRGKYNDFNDNENQFPNQEQLTGQKSPQFKNI